MPHPGAGRLERQIDMAALRLHPAGELASGIPNGPQGGNDLEHVGFVARPIAEILRNRFCDRGPVVRHHAAQTTQRLLPRLQIRGRYPPGCLTLTLEYSVQVTVGNGPVGGCFGIL